MRGTAARACVCVSGKHGQQVNEMKTEQLKGIVINGHIVSNLLNTCEGHRHAMYVCVGGGGVDRIKEENFSRFLLFTSETGSCPNEPLFRWEAAPVLLGYLTGPHSST